MINSQRSKAGKDANEESKNAEGDEIEDQITKKVKKTKSKDQFFDREPDITIE